MLPSPVHSALQINFRNREKLQAYQREYARRKRAPGNRKVSKAERQLLEEQYVKKQSLMKVGGVSQAQRSHFFQFVLSPLAI